MDAMFDLGNLMIWNGFADRFQPGRIQIRNGFISEVNYTNNDSKKSQVRWAIPAFTDSHVHLVNYAIAQSFLFLDGMPLESIQEKVAQIAKASSPAHWIRGRGWEAAQRKQGGFPHREELDGIAPNHPVALSSKDGHSLWLNSRALHDLGINPDIPDPPGGRFDRDPDGKLTGVILENAVEIARRNIPPVPEYEKRHLLRKAITKLHSFGIVAVHSFEGLSEINLLTNMAESGELNLKVTVSFNIEDLDQVIAQRVRSGQTIAGIQIAGLKLFADGALGSRTASIAYPYTGEPENFGMCVMNAEQLMAESLRAADYGFPTAIHAIGDVAVKNALDALITVKMRHPNLKALRVEHIQLVDPTDLNRFAQNDITASIQPCHMVSDIEMAERFWGEQTSMRYPYASLADSGARVVFGSDAPIDNENPLLNIRAAITRRRRTGVWSDRAWYPQECMKVVDAFRSATSVPAELENPPQKRGCLIPGAAADIVILEENPFDQIFEAAMPSIIAVFINGQRVQ